MLFYSEIFPLKHKGFAYIARKGSLSRGLSIYF